MSNFEAHIVSCSHVVVQMNKDIKIRTVIQNSSIRIRIRSDFLLYVRKDKILANGFRWDE